MALAGVPYTTAVSRGFLANPPNDPVQLAQQRIMPAHRAIGSPWESTSIPIAYRATRRVA